MSGIYIPGMKMPTSCYLCPVNKDDGFGFFTCGMTHYECDFQNLPSNCPLIPVPEHGDLIDRDALKRRAKKGTDEHGRPCMLIKLGYVNTMPAIIPAEEGE